MKQAVPYALELIKPESHVPNTGDVPWEQHSSFMHTSGDQHLLIQATSWNYMPLKNAEQMFWLLASLILLLLLIILVLKLVWVCLPVVHTLPFVR